MHTAMTTEAKANFLSIFPNSYLEISNLCKKERMSFGITEFLTLGRDMISFKLCCYGPNHLKEAEKIALDYCGALIRHNPRSSTWLKDK